MNIVVLKEVRESAQAWWYHRALRRQGQVEEARRLEHESMKRNLKAIRDSRKHNIPLVVTDQRWWYETVHEEANHTGVCSGGGHNQIAIWKAAGLPIVDLSALPSPSSFVFKHNPTYIPGKRTRYGGWREMTWDKFLTLAWLEGATVIHPNFPH